MKNLVLTLLVMVMVVASSSLQAQTTKTCSPEQVEACKKICTPEQIAACQKICNGKTASASAVKVVNQAPTAKASCQKPCTKTAAANTETSNLVKLVALGETTTKEGKKKQCAPSPSCASKKE